ncbi:MAG: hypothetical protein WC441_04845 [Patescibacteria group bacterium]
MPVINQKIDSFLGLNNLLNPSSAEYREGMAYRSLCARIDEKGLWSAQQFMSGVANAPSVIASPTGGGNYLKSLNVNGVEKIVNMLVSVSCDVGPNKHIYSTNGSYLKNVAGNVVAMTRPSVPTAVTDTTAASRAQDGTYYYMCTYYDTVYLRESLPSPVDSADLDTTGAQTNIKITPAGTIPANCKVRIYRSKRTSSNDNEYNATNIFYFLTEQASNEVYYDYLHDTEIENSEYEGRGTDPVTALGGVPDYLISFNNRMLYFRGNVLGWSSAGRPEEVAKNYTISFNSKSIECKPKLSIGLYAEAKYEISELRGHKVLAAFPLGGKLWIWTETMMGCLEPTNRYEGYKFYLAYEGVGVTSDKVLSLSPYGLFGADYQGVWLFTGTGRPKRLTDKRINLLSGQDTTFSTTDFANSFGCYVPALNEFWWGVSGKVLAYQADRDIFVGPYNYSIDSGCMIPSGTIGTMRAHNYFTGGLAPNPTLKTSVQQILEFWLGQATLTTIKDQVIVEVLHSQTPGAAVLLDLYQNSITSTTGATSPIQISYVSVCGKVLGKSSGRFFMVKVTLPTAGAPIAAINYKYNPAGDTLG